MKNRNKKSIIHIVKSKANQDTYYTNSSWDTKDIDGITFISVVKNDPNVIRSQHKHWMRKDNLDFFTYIKE